MTIPLLKRRDILFSILNQTKLETRVNSHRIAVKIELNVKITFGELFWFRKFDFFLIFLNEKWTFFIVIIYYKIFFNFHDLILNVAVRILQRFLKHYITTTNLLNIIDYLHLIFCRVNKNDFY